MDHPCAFGAADEVNSIPGHLEPSRRGFRARVRGADRQRQFRERARGGATKPRDDRQGAKNFVQRQRPAEDARGAQPIRFAASATVRTAAAWPAAPVAQLALPAFTTTARMRPFEARRCSLEISTGAATTRFCVKTAAAEAGTSLERIARSSAPVFFKPHAVAAKRNPRGKEASESACFINGTSV